MFRLDASAKSEVGRVSKAAEKTAFRNLGHAANRIMKDARASIVTNQNAPSAAGSPPHTKAQAGHNLRTAIRYDSNKEDAVVGPMASMVGEAGATHEFGQERGGVDYPERPFMGPALERNLDRFADSWRGAITE